ncbi:MAG: alginate lyase family protein [Cyanobacteriota bacterium]|nr:alginate lyase family protein [Cyanobacteriota bacterium]
MPFRLLGSALRQMLAPPTGALPPVAPPLAILTRILGNDGAPLRPPGTTLGQLRFLLEHEPQHPGLEKRWLLHRIADPGQRQALVDLLERHQQIWSELPFEASEYAACWTDNGSVPREHHPWNPAFKGLSQEEQARVIDYLARRKSLYLFNRNLARNHLLQQEAAEARWLFPWDGDCFLTPQAWEVIRPLLDLPQLTYLAVPTAEVEDCQRLLAPLDAPPLDPAGPQLGFASGALGRFHPDLREGAGAGVDLPRRLALGVPARVGIGSPCPWEAVDVTPVADRAQLVQAGWTYRLPPLAVDDPVSGRQTIRLVARRTDMRLVSEALERQPLRCWTGLDGASAPSLAAIAANARTVPPLSVADRADALPEAPARSYVNAVPHWQSLAGSESALDRSSLLSPPGPACGDVALHYDRARLQLMIDCVCALALDGHLHGNVDSFRHAHRMVRAWFLDPATAMIPDGAYARLSAVEVDSNALDAAIDFRDFYPLLDALSLLRRAGWFSLAEQQQLDEWFDAFLRWLAEDSEAFLQQHSASTACTWYHLLMLAIAAYRGRRNVAAQVFDNLPGLLADQFRQDGSPRSGDAGAQLRHEQLFNLQAWANLVVISSALGRDLLALRDSQGIGLPVAFAHASRHLPDQQTGGIALTAQDWLATMQAQMRRDRELVPAPDLPPLAEASSGIPPFWALCRPVALWNASPMAVHGSMPQRSPRREG